MSSQVHLQLMSQQPEAISQVSWLHMRDGQAEGGLKQGDLQQAAEDIGSASLVVYIPGIDVLLTQVALPAGRKSQLLKALPYALEDNLIDDIESLHCALGPRMTNDMYSVAVIASNTLQQWLAMLREADLHPQALLPDILMLPWQTGTWTLFCDDQSVYVRTGLAEGFVCDMQTLPALLQQVIAEHADNKPESIRIINSGESVQQQLNAAFPDVKLETEQLNAPANSMNLLLQYGIQQSGLNLLQGAYAPQNPIKQQLKPWYAAAALALIWLGLGLTGDIAEYLKLKQQNQQLQQQIVNVFKQTFPGVKRIVNPQAQMKHHLKQLRGQSQGQSFNLLVSQLAPVTKQVDNVSVQHLRYHEGQMELLLELPDLQSLETLKQRLSKATSWRVELKSANTGDNKVQGRIVISKT